MSSWSARHWQNLIGAVVFLTLAVLGFVFLINKASVWFWNTNTNAVDSQPVLAKTSAKPINNLIEAKSFQSAVLALENEKEIKMSLILNLIDQLVATGYEIDDWLLEIKNKGIDAVELQDKIDEYYLAVDDLIKEFNQLEWQVLPEGDSGLVTGQNKKKQIFLSSLSKVVDLLIQVMTEFDKMIIVSSGDRPAQCAFQNVRAVYGCEDGFKKVIVLNGYEMYNRDGNKIVCNLSADSENKNCQVECFEDMDLCQ
jgi:hypothetical protein